MMTAAADADGFSEDDRGALAVDAKVGLLATLGPEGLPHVTLITSLEAGGPRELLWGQFCDGLSKRHVLKDPRVGFLVMTPDRRVWRGTAEWRRLEREGPDYVRFNQKPMFRYNTYFGIHTVHRMDLVALERRARLPLAGMLAGTLAMAAARHLVGSCAAERALKPWAEQLLSGVRTLKFLAYVGPDGYPRIVAGAALMAADSRTLVVAPTVRRRELLGLAPGTTVAVFAVNLKMQSVLVRGTLCGWRRLVGLRTGRIDIDWVYNSMPPQHGQVYPPRRPQPVRDFEAVPAL